MEQRKATGVTRVREWRDGVPAEASGTRAKPGTVEGAQVMLPLETRTGRVSEVRKSIARESVRQIRREQHRPNRGSRRCYDW